MWGRSSTCVWVMTPVERVLPGIWTGSSSELRLAVSQTGETSLQC